MGHFKDKLTDKMEKERLEEEAEIDKLFQKHIKNMSTWAANYCAGNQANYNTLMIGVVNGLVVAQALLSKEEPVFHTNIQQLLNISATEFKKDSLN